MLNSSGVEPARPAWFWPVVGTIIIVLTSAAWLIIPEQRAHRQLLTCHENLRQIALAIRQYSMDNDEKFPPVRISSAGHSTGLWGWADAVAPYTANPGVFQCPRESTPPQPDPSQSGYTDYWYNGNMAGVSEGSVAFTPRTLLVGEGSDGIDVTSAQYNKRVMPAQWLTDTTKPSFRHAPGANYAFVDGHVKWCEPGAVASAAPAYDTYSFGLR